MLWGVSTVAFWRHLDLYVRIAQVLNLVSSALLITLLAGLALLLRPWSPRSGFGGQMARVVLFCGVAAALGLIAADFLVPRSFWTEHWSVTIGIHWLPPAIRSLGIAMLGVGLIRERRPEPVFT